MSSSHVERNSHVILPCRSSLCDSVLWVMIHSIRETDTQQQKYRFRIDMIYIYIYIYCITVTYCISQYNMLYIYIYMYNVYCTDLYFYVITGGKTSTRLHRSAPLSSTLSRVLSSPPAESDPGPWTAVPRFGFQAMALEHWNCWVLGRVLDETNQVSELRRRPNGTQILRAIFMGKIST